MNGSGIFRSKKGDAGNTWWVIIGAVLALVVLGVVLYIFVSKTRPAQESLSACTDKGGLCVPGTECPQGTLSTSAFECAGSNTLCCIGFVISCEIDEDCEGGACRPVGDKRYCFEQ